jgi:tripartite-type tricarboxylate transporter receptor subunit TctC
LLVSTVSTYAMAPHLMPLPYDNEKDFVGIGLIASMPIIMVVNPSFPARTLAEYVEIARRPNSNSPKSGSNSRSSHGPGGSQHHRSCFPSWRSGTASSCACVDSEENAAGDTLVVRA